MISEWMKVMLEEISRKKAEAEQTRAEELTRAQEQARAVEQPRVVIESESRAPRETRIGDAE
jgi:hypothetical protein